jgi:hypothetical protein
MKDFDPGRSGREDYNPETEGKPADRDRSTGNNPKGMRGSQSDRDRNTGTKGQQSDRDRGGNVREPDRGAPTDPSRSRSGSTEDELNDEDSALERDKRSRESDLEYEDPDQDR